MRDPDLMSLKMCALVAVLDNVGANCKFASFCGTIVWPLATWTRGPVVVRRTLMQCGSAEGSK